MSGQQQQQKGGGGQPSKANKKRKSLFLFGIICTMTVIYILQMTGLDAAIPKIIGTVGYWFNQNWETPVRASLGTAMFVIFFGSALIGGYLAKQEEA